MLKRQSDKIEFLKKVPLFAGMSKKDLTAVARVAEEVTVSSGEIILFQDFLALLGDSPALARRLLAQLADRLAAADKKLYG